MSGGGPAAPPALTVPFPLWQRLIAAAVIAAAAWFVWASSVRTIFAPNGPVVGVLHERFDNGTITPPATAEITGYQPCPGGWCLGPGATGSLIYKFRMQHGIPWLDLWFYKPPRGTNTLSFSVDGGAGYQKITENARHVGVRFDFGRRVPAGQEVWLRFDAVNETDQPALVVDEIQVLYRPLVLTRLPSRAHAFAIVLSFGAAIVVLCPPGAWGRRWPLAASTLVIVAIGAALRYGAAADLAGEFLDPDAITYRSYVDVMRPFTETGFFSARFGIREPLFIFVARVYGWLFGNSDFGLRMLTVILSTGSIWAVLRVGRGLFGNIAGQLIGLVMAVNGPLVAEAARGLRLELEIVLVMIFVALAFLTPRLTLFRAAVALSLVGGLLALTRSTYVPVMLALTAYALVPRARGWPSWALATALAAGIVVACVAPHRYHMYRVNGDPFYDTAVYARWNANFEFAGQPGFPTLEDLRRDGAQGPPITYGEYMWGLHTPAEVLVGTVRGFVKLFGYMEVCPAPPLGIGPGVCRPLDLAFRGLALIGFAIALWRPAYRWIPLAFVLFELPVSFLFDRGFMEQYRHSYSSYAFVLLAAALTLVTLAHAIQSRRRPFAADAAAPAA